MLSLSRVLGGSLRGKETAHLIADEELDQLVCDLLRSVPEIPAYSEKKPAASWPCTPAGIISARSVCRAARSLTRHRRRRNRTGRR